MLVPQHGLSVDTLWFDEAVWFDEALRGAAAALLLVVGLQCHALWVRIQSARAPQGGARRDDSDTGMD